MTNNNIMQNCYEALGVTSFIQNAWTERYIDYCRDLIMDPDHWLP